MGYDSYCILPDKLHLTSGVTPNQKSDNASHKRNYGTVSNSLLTVQNRLFNYYVKALEI